MSAPNNRHEALPLTSVKLNYFLSQLRKTSTKIVKNKRQKIVPFYQQALSKPTMSNANQKPKINLYHNNVIKQQEPFYFQHQNSKGFSNCNDSLDYLISLPENASYCPAYSCRKTDRPQVYSLIDDFPQLNKSEYYSKKQKLKNYDQKQINCSEIYSSRIRNNIKDIFGFKNNQKQESINKQSSQNINYSQVIAKRQNKKKLNFNSKISQRASKNKMSFDNGISDISKELAKINYQINANSRKLKQISNLCPVVKRTDLKECIRRANSKFANFKQEQKQSQKLMARSRPIIRYYNSLAQNNIIWQPYYLENTHKKQQHNK